MIVQYPPPVAARAPKIRPRRRARIAVLALGACFIGLQLLPAPARDNPEAGRTRTLEASVPVPENIARLMQRACADCHSDRTRWPWYSRMAPMSWMIGSHVQEGREAMNFSDWYGVEDVESRALGAAKLSASCEALASGLMPPSSYLLLHREARLSPAEKRAFCDWVHQTVPGILPPHPPVIRSVLGQNREPDPHGQTDPDRR